MEKRLLRRNGDSIERVCHYGHENRCYDCADRTKCNADIFDRLAHYEDLEEQGRLVELPCRIDEPIFLIRAEKGPRKKMKFWVDEYEIDHFTIGGTMIPMITACSKENEWEELIDGTQNGYEYFLSRSEAEAALAASGKEG